MPFATGFTETSSEETDPSIDASSRETGIEKASIFVNVPRRFQYQEVYLKLVQKLSHVYSLQDTREMQPKELAEPMQAQWYNYEVKMMTLIVLKKAQRRVPSMNRALEEDGFQMLLVYRLFIGFLDACHFKMASRSLKKTGSCGEMSANKACIILCLLISLVFQLLMPFSLTKLLIRLQQ